jgi:hypothetical protein
MSSSDSNPCKQPRAPHRHGRPDGGDAFFPDPGGGPTKTSDPLAEQLGEEYVTSATSAEEAAEDDVNQLLPEEIGGPFLEEPAELQFARTSDATNPLNGDKEPFPTAMRSEK